MYVIKIPSNLQNFSFVSAEFVKCSNCRHVNTTMEKNKTTRLYFMKCNDCGAEKSVSAIKSGPHAVTRAERRAARQN